MREIPVKLPRLIACDIDGTLMAYDESDLSPRLFPLIEALEARGVLFCPASGRQYASLRRLFALVADRLIYLCENGGILYGRDGEVLGRTVMERSRALALSRDILAQPACELLISGANMSYVVCKRPGLDEQLRHFTGNRVTVLSCPEEMPEAFLKVSAYCPDGAARYAPLLGPTWAAEFPMAIGGPKWLDFALADKGTGMRILLAALAIDPAEVMAFGDNANDLPMLEAVGMPYVVDRSPLRDLPADWRRCERVEDVLEALLELSDRRA